MLGDGTGLAVSIDNGLPFDLGERRAGMENDRASAAKEEGKPELIDEDGL